MMKILRNIRTMIKFRVSPETLNTKMFESSFNIRIIAIFFRVSLDSLSYACTSSRREEWYDFDLCSVSQVFAVSHLRRPVKNTSIHDRLPFRS